MRIVIDLQGAQSTGSRNRGIGRYTLALAQSIAANRGEHEVLIVLNGLFSDTIELIRSSFYGLLSQENILVWNSVGPVSYINAKNNWRRGVAELSREAFLMSLSPDIVHITSIFEGSGDDVVASIGLLGNKIPTAVTLYDLIPLINRATYLANPVVESWYENKVDHIQRAGLLLAISESSRQEGIDYLGFSTENAVNIGAAADPQFKIIDIDPKMERHVRERYGLFKPFVMYTGGVDHRKNIEGLIRAYALIPKPLRDQHQLAIVCSVPSDVRRKLNALAACHGLSNNDLILTGFVPEIDLIALYHLCKVFVFPSWHEGFGLPVLEAMCCGAPVIAANTSSLPEVVGREDALFDPHDDNAIAIKIESVIADDAYRLELIQHSLLQSKKFTWSNCAKLALNAFEKLHADNLKKSLPFVSSKLKLKLAYVSPLPPDRTGISDYSIDLLKELVRYYQIDVIVAQGVTTNSWVQENCTVRSAAWFSKHGHIYDRVVYNFGNSRFHVHMFDLLEKIPGIVVLHDFFLGHVVTHMDRKRKYRNILTKSIYRSHGFRAVRERFKVKDKRDIAWKYPSNKSVLDNAVAVVVHSENSKRLAQSWYGKSIDHNWSVIPLLRKAPLDLDSANARRAIGISEDTFVVSSFGMLGSSKQNKRLLDAWLMSELGKDDRCILIFVGENDSGDYGRDLISLINKSGASQRIIITGWVDELRYQQYLIASNIAVQLRTLSRGETSASVLDCMNYGLATIVNANGSVADIPVDAVKMLPDDFEDVDLGTAIEELWRNSELRGSLGVCAHELIQKYHDPSDCADKYFQVIEKYSNKESLLFDAIGELDSKFSSNQDRLLVANSIAKNKITPRVKKLFLDVSILMQDGTETDIKKMARRILWEFLENPPAGFVVEPVYSGLKEICRYARKFTLDFMGCPNNTLNDDPVDVGNGDIYLCLGFSHKMVLTQPDFYAHMRRIGVKVYGIVYDLLPVLIPHYFSTEVRSLHERGLQLLSQADGAICASRAVADELATWLGTNNPARSHPLKIGWFHLGAYWGKSVPVKNPPKDVVDMLQSLSVVPTFLSLGMIEPHKGHWQTLAAFEQLWAQGVNINLMIVGDFGWNTESLAQALHYHSENGRRLFFLNGISDEYLANICLASSCLIAASEGDGSGFPVIEVGQHEVSIIARDIPIFREMAGENSLYFSGNSPSELANTVLEWLVLYGVDKVPNCKNIQSLTWRESKDNLLDIVLRDRWYLDWMPHDIRHLLGGVTG